MIRFKRSEYNSVLKKIDPNLSLGSENEIMDQLPKKDRTNVEKMRRKAA